MSDRLLIGTKKGLFELRRLRGSWDIAQTRFLGEPISMFCTILATVRCTPRRRLGTLA